MTSPYISTATSSGSVNIKVNNLKPDRSGNITVPLSSLSDMLLTSLADGDVIKYDSSTQKFKNGVGSSGSLSGLTDVWIPYSALDGGQVLSYVSRLQKWINWKLSHTQLDDIGTTSHTNLDLFYNSKGVASGLASLDSTGKVQISQIPAIAITNVFTANTIQARNALTVQTGDVAIVVSDPTPSNNSSYIYDGSTWKSLVL